MELHEATALWLECQPVPGVAFRPNDPVEIREGEYAGQVGSTVALLALIPEPRYLIELEPTGEDVEVAQSQLDTV
jgi:hypothetical protein